MLAVYLCPKWLKDKNPSLKTSIQKIFEREEALRYNEMGYNCYIYPNDPKNVVDSEKWLTADSFTEFNNLFVDMDLKEGVYKTKEEFYEALVDFPVSPRLVVDSGNGVHAYWPVETVGPLDYLKLQRKLARALKTDVAVCQLKQLMRLPGTTNTKDPGNFKMCEVVFESDDQEPLPAKAFDKIPGLSKEDARYCEEHFDKAFNKAAAETSGLKDLPESFVKLLKEDEYAASLWYRTNGKDRSSNDMALARLLHERDFSKEEAIQVLVNSDKVEDRNDRSKISYAENTVNKVWDAPSNKPKVEQTSIDDYDIFEIAQTVDEILKEKKEEEASKRLACHPAIDNTVHGLRLGQVIGLVGGSGIGKTTLALNMFYWFAERNQDKVHMFFGLEQSRGELAERWDKITKGNSDLNRKVIIVSNHVKNKPSLNLGLDDIERLILDYEKKSGLKVGCVTIDHIGLLKRKPRDTEIQGIMDASVKMKLVAERTQTLIVMQSQASRQKAGEGDIELGKSAAYGSMYFESNCDYLMTLWQPLKRLYSQGAPTVIAFKFCKIRHKNVTRDVIKEDQKYMLYFEPDSDTLTGLQEADLKHINEWWLGKAAEARGVDVDTDLTPYRSAC